MFGNSYKILEAIICFPVNLIFIHYFLFLLYKKFLRGYKFFQKLLVCFGTYIIIARFYFSVNLPCDNSDKLTSLYFATQDLLHAAEVSFVPCFGTLLGMHRDGKIIPWEYDIDLCLTEDMCRRVYEKKDMIESSRISVYRAQEITPWYISLHWLGSKTFTKPCVRIYFGLHMVDLYPWVPTTVGELKSRKLGLHREPEQGVGSEYYTKWSNQLLSSAMQLGVEDDEKLFCSAEYCFLPEHIYPYASDTFLGRNIQSVSNPDAMCKQMYGSTWKTPYVKGVKHDLCQTSPWWFYCFGMALIVCAMRWSPITSLKQYITVNKNEDATSSDSDEIAGFLKVN